MWFLVFFRISIVKKCQKSRQILKSSSSGMVVHWMRTYSPFCTDILRNSMFSLACMVLVLASINVKFWVSVELTARQTCLHKFSKFDCCFEPTNY